MPVGHNVRVKRMRKVLSPREVREELPVPHVLAQKTILHRSEIAKILHQTDDRFLVVVGPCSIHDTEASLEYAGKLAELQRRLRKIKVVMRTYFEKPRTTIGWKGLINDPDVSGGFDIESGLRRARELLIEVVKKDLPVGTEFLDPTTPQYFSELVSWASIGARTTESQTHRQMASGLSMPVGYKNATSGEILTAVNAMVSARNPHHFLGVDDDGCNCIVETTGNPDGHLILRGGEVPNYFPESIRKATRALLDHNMQPSLLVDCSHANCERKSSNQVKVWDSIISQRKRNPNIIGAMLESFLFEGKQAPNSSELRYGVSITDECLSWEQTRGLLLEAEARL